jgi:CHASE3 domain sensor protein
MPHAPASPVATLLSPSGFRAVPVLLVAGFALLIAMVATSLFLSVRLSQNVIETGQISDYRKTITDVFNQARDSEIGQRGYLLTGNTEFLKPYESASKALAPTLAEMVSIDGERGKRVAAELEPLARAKMAELATTIALYKAGKSDEVLAIVRGGQGKRLMDAMRAIFERERGIALDRSKALERASRTTVWWLTLVLVGGMVALLVIAVLWFRQARSQFAVIDLSRAEAEGALAALKTEAAAREASEAQLRQLQKMEAIGQLTGGIAHDFNNMLAVVMGSLELAQRRLPEGAERVSKLLDNAREGATRAAALTARLLAFSRQQPLAPKPIETGKLIDGMCDMLTRTLGDAISVECVNSAGLWRCYADASEVENAILNLAVNARDAMPDGGKLTIESANAHIDDNYGRIARSSRASMLPSASPTPGWACRPM